MNCQRVRTQITLYLYNELDDPERVEMEMHADTCAVCAAEIERERAVGRAFDRRERAAGDATLLAECRARLMETIEDQPRSVFQRARAFGWVPGLLHSFKPAFAALLLVAGFAGGWAVSAWRGGQPVLPGNGNEELNVANISSIQAINSDGQGNLEIVLDTTRRRVVRGVARDPRMEQLLVYAANNYANPGIRLDSIEHLKNRAGETDVRVSLISALRTDLNAGVRLKALEALREFGDDPEVKMALLHTLRRDDNPGVRIEAIEQLGRLRDVSNVPLLQQLAAGDPNSYVRLRSASALRDLNAPENY